MFQKLHTSTLMERAGMGVGGDSEGPAVGLPTTAALILPSVFASFLVTHQTRLVFFCHSIHSVSPLTIEGSLSCTFL